MSRLYRTRQQVVRRIDGGDVSADRGTACRAWRRWARRRLLRARRAAGGTARDATYGAARRALAGRSAPRPDSPLSVRARLRAPARPTDRPIAAGRPRQIEGASSTHRGTRYFGRCERRRETRHRNVSRLPSHHRRLRLRDAIPGLASMQRPTSSDLEPGRRTTIAGHVSRQMRRRPVRRTLEGDHHSGFGSEPRPGRRGGRNDHGHHERWRTRASTRSDHWRSSSSTLSWMTLPRRASRGHP
jgi:hypothetical protein